VRFQVSSIHSLLTPNPQPLLRFANGLQGYHRKAGTRLQIGKSVAIYKAYALAELPMTPEQEQAIAELRTKNLAPKQIARQLGLRPAEVTAVLKGQAEQIASTRLATGELDPVYECLVNRGCLKGWISTTNDSQEVALQKSDDDSDDGNAGSGFALVVVARQPGFDRIIMCSYLVDIWCLGVKDAMPPRKMNLGEYKEFSTHIYSNFFEGTEKISLELAQAIVFGGVEYAAKLRFQPHRDFEKARAHLGEWNGEPKLTFGKDGKPFYMSGPYDNPQKIIKTLLNSVGEGNFHYMVGIGEPGF
jgi:hypothetical protein